MKTYELHIENLVLHGIDPADRYRVGDALEREMARELARLFSGPDAAAITRSVEIGALDAGALELQPGATSAGIGVQLARAIHGSLTTGSRAGSNFESGQIHNPKRKTHP